MKKITRNIATLMLLTVAATAATAQVVEQKVGDNSLIINPNAVLEIESTNRGLLLPRLELKATDNFEPLAAHVEGMTVYNTAASDTTVADENKVTPGYYYNDGAKWVRIATGADAKTEPWKVQDTGAEADDNEQDIYQEGKVAVGFTDADAVSAYQLEVKGDFKSEYTDSDGWIKGISNNVQSIFGDGIIGMYSADNEDFTIGQGNYDQISLTGNPIVGGVTLASKRDTPDGPNVGNIAVQNTAFGMTMDMQATNAADDRASRISLGGIYRVNLTDKTTGGLGAGITISDHRGVQFRFDDATGATEGVYYFPRNNGTAGQVLTTDGSTGIAQLSWADASSLVDINEPWRIQNTTTDATANDDDIYQEGRVAVGFTDADAVSDKQLEVKGDFKAEVTDGDIIFGSEVNSSLAPQSSGNYWINTATGAYKVSATRDDMALIEAGTATTSSIHSVEDTHATMASLQNNNSAKSEIRTQNDGNFFMESYNVANDFGSTLSLQDDGLRLVHTTTNGATDPFPDENRSEIMVQKETGVRFSFNDEDGDPKGEYTFPTTTGNTGQIMTQTATGDIVWADGPTVIDYSYTVQETGRQWVNDDTVYELTADITLATNTNLVTLPATVASDATLIGVRLISKATGSISTNIISYDAPTRELVLGTAGLMTTLHPAGDYYIVVEYVSAD